MSSTKSITEKEVQTLIQGKLSRYYGVSPKEASIDQIYKAVVMSVRDILLEKRQQFHKVMMSKKGKRVYYLCMEFLLGRSLKNNIYNLGLNEEYEKALKFFGLTLEDFEQEGFFAVKRAAEYHDPEKGSFLTALQYFVKHQIQAATIGGHGRYMTTDEGKMVRLPADPLSSASSLDEQLPSDDDDRSLVDVVADPAAVQAFKDTEEALYLEQLRAILDKALAMLPELQREVVRGRFFEKLTLKQAGECVGVSTSRAAQLEYYGLRAMRRNASLRRFYGEDLLSRAYRGTGFGAWAHRGSVEERLVERQEEKERRLAAANTKHLAELLDLDVAELCGLMDE